MRPTARHIAVHLGAIGGVTALLVLCIIYPFLPGRFDAFAVALSTMAQVVGVGGLLLVPIGVAWLASDLWQRTRPNRSRSAPVRSYGFALAALLVASLVALAVAGVATATVGWSLGVLTGALWLVVVARLLPRLRRLTITHHADVTPVPFYLIVIPSAVLLVQLTLAPPLTAMSRDYALTRSVALIADLEAYHGRHGRYPPSLLAVWNDYDPAVIGIPQFQYAPSGAAYNVVFEQPRFLLDNVGAREFVVYNPRDEQAMISHNSWILLLQPDELDATPGWFAVQDAARPHWKSFWFD